MRGSIYQKVLYAALVLTTALMMSRVSLADSKNEVRLRAQLTGSAIGGITPSGNADFRSDSRGRTRLNVEVEHVNLPKGTVLSVTIMHAGATAAIGSITLNAFGSGELELNSQDGETVPAVVKGDVVTVMNGAAAVVAGVF
jgi:hypothetical protein